MQTFIGTKLVEAEPMTAQQAGQVLNRPINTENADADGNGYLVKYKDGYTSWSPKTAFDEAYRPLSKLTFGDALHLLKSGERVARRGWNGKGMWLGLQTPDEHSKMGLPYIFMSTVTGQLVPWLASQTDMLAEDWELLE